MPTLLAKNASVLVYMVVDGASSTTGRLSPWTWGPWSTSAIASPSSSPVTR